MDRIHCTSSGFATENTSCVANMEEIFLSLGVVQATKHVVKGDTVLHMAS